MARSVLTPIEQRIRQTRRRLFLQALLNRTIGCLAVALAISAAWFLLQPWLLEQPPTWLRWAVLGSLCGLGLLIALIWTIRSMPSRLVAALQLDQRFQLRERITTALSLSEWEQSTSAGKALVEDAVAKVKELSVRSQFPLQLDRRSVLIPIQASAIVLIALFYNPSLSSGNVESEAKKQAELDKLKLDDPQNPANANKPLIRKPADRLNKSEELKQLEGELDKLYAEASKKEDNQDQAREKVEQIAKLEEKLKKMEMEKAEQFQRMQEQMQKLGRMEKDELSPDGPAKEFQEALSKGDLDQAQKEVDELKKKIKEKKLSEEEMKQLAKQLENMEQKLERNAKNEAEQKKLKELIEKAKQEGRDADALERELKNLQEEAAKNKDLLNLAKKMAECKKCLDQKDFDGLSDKLGDLAKDLENMKEQLEDLEDLDEHLQNLKDLKKKKCKDGGL